MENPAPNRTFSVSQITMAIIVFTAILGLFAAVAWHLHPERRVARLVRTLQDDPDPARRGSAARELGDLGTVALSSAIPALAKALDDEGQYLTPGFLIPVEHRVCQDAFETLKRLGGREAAAAMVDVLQRSCPGETFRSSFLAGQVLVAIGPDAASVTPRLVTLLGECRNAQTSTAIVSALLANVPDTTSDSARELPAALSDYFFFSGSEVRIQAAQLLVAVAPHDDKTMVRLIDATQTQDVYTAEIGELVLRNFGTRAIPELVERLGHVNHPAVVTLLKTFPATEVLPALRDSLQAPAAQRRRGAGLVIAGMPIREGDIELVRNLLREVEEGPPEPRAGLFIALLRRVPGSREESAHLIQISSGELDDSPFSPTALYGGISFNDVWALPWLEHSLTAASPGIRMNAAMALERFGPGARAALPALLTALKDTDEEVCKAVAKAVAAIDR